MGIPLIRQAVPADAAGILAIYAPFIEKTTITFETAIPSLDDFTARVAGIAERYPYLVLEEGGEITAYAYASRHMERAAYAYNAQTSVYVAPHAQGKGCGKILYQCLFKLLKALGYYNAYAGITMPNDKSLALHRSFGFEEIGVYRRTGYKFGTWLDVVWLGKVLADFAQPPEEIKAIGDIDPDVMRIIVNSGSKSISVRRG